MSIISADGFVDLGLWQDAWDEIESLPPDERATLDALRVRLSCCAALGAWEIGSSVASLLKDGDATDQQLTADFFVEIAVRSLERNSNQEARTAITSAIDCWPGIKLEILDHPILSALF